MANAALFIGWGKAVTGREQQALKILNEAVQYYGRLQQQGQAEEARNPRARARCRPGEAP